MAKPGSQDVSMQKRNQKSEGPSETRKHNGVEVGFELRLRAHLDLGMVHRELVAAAAAVVVEQPLPACTGRQSGGAAWRPRNRAGARRKMLGSWKGGGKWRARAEEQERSGGGI